jgi:hypothetical protein
VSDITEQRRRELVEAQIAHYQQQARWEVPKALAAIAAAAAIFMGCVLAGITWLHPAPPPPQQITVRLDQPLHVQVHP